MPTPWEIRELEKKEHEAQNTITELKASLKKKYGYEGTEDAFGAFAFSFIPQVSHAYDVITDERRDLLYRNHNGKFTIRIDELDRIEKILNGIGHELRSAVVYTGKTKMHNKERVRLLNRATKEREMMKVSGTPDGETKGE